MKAAVWTHLPNTPSSSILVRVRAAGISQADRELRGLNLPSFLQTVVRLIYGLVKPKAPGVPRGCSLLEQVGSQVKEFKIGDAVYGSTGGKMGCYAEYLVVSEDKAIDRDSFIARKPAHLSFEEASVSALNAMEAFGFFERVKMKDGESVLILGAGGNFGTFLVQLAKKHFNASRVVAVDGGDDKVDMLRSLGVDKTVDYTKEGYVETTQDRFDIIIDIPGKFSFAECTGILNENGRFAKGMYGFGE
ncbi:UNVERIFIED_CONTAM: hypothetical protein HDU68_011603 [Siphonaria sp. JEL0065]|nr:hypothetical protein HDU68_011603 [Siphonaria sp. JEL0065]